MRSPVMPAAALRVAEAAAMASRSSGVSPGAAVLT